MQILLNTLYVMTPNAYVHLENDTVRVDVDREKRLQVPLHHLGSIVCFGNIMLSPASCTAAHKTVFPSCCWTQVDASRRGWRAPRAAIFSFAKRNTIRRRILHSL